MTHPVKESFMNSKNYFLTVVGDKQGFHFSGNHSFIKSQNDRPSPGYEITGSLLNKSTPLWCLFSINDRMRNSSLLTKKSLNKYLIDIR